MTTVIGNVQDSINRINILGNIEMFEATKIRETLWELAWVEGYTDVEIDLENVEYIDSSGLGVLTSFVVMLRKANKKVTVLRAKEKVIEVFHLAGLDKFIFGDQKFLGRRHE